MMKNIFIPEKIGSYFIYPKRILGFDIGKTQVNATLVLLKGRTIRIEKNIKVPLDSGSTGDYDNRVAAAIKTIAEQIGSYDAIHTSLASSLVVFKELKLPFLQENKIRMVIDFEVEPLLPFSLNNAVIDFIITKKNLEEKSSELMVAAVQKSHIVEHLNLFALANLNPELITVDLFALYGLYSLIPSYANIRGSVVLIDLGAYSTRITYLYDGQLRLIRSLPKGILQQAKDLGALLNMQPNEAMESIMRFGLEKIDSPQYTQAITEVFSSFWKNISFTLSSFTIQTHQGQGINRIFLLGGGSEIKGIAPFATNQLSIHCEPFRTNKILELDNVSLSNSNVTSQLSVIALSTALPTPTTAHFNMRKKEFALTVDSSLFNKQLISALSLITLSLLCLTAHYIIQTKKLSNAANRAEQEVIEDLKKQFKKIRKDEDDLEKVIKNARSEVKNREKLWFSLADPSRVSMLQYLLELTTKIDKEGLGFTIDRLTITDNVMTIVASVKDYISLAILEKKLRHSKLFVDVEEQSDPEFTMKIRLAKKSVGRSHERH